jgi:chloramphenicol-sensitive protein RarD
MVLRVSSRMMYGFSDGLSVQLWLFLWSPANGHLLDLSMGYFLLPLAMTLVGCTVYGERLNAMQAAACLLASVGVVHAWWMTHSFSWVSVVVVFGYTPYFMLRKWMRMHPVVGFALETSLMLPAAVVMLVHAAAQGSVVPSAAPWLVLPLLGIVSAAAMGCYMASSQILPFSLFGMLSFVEPVLLFITSAAGVR